MKVPISDFIIESDFRKEREGLGELAFSIKSIGLLQPILVSSRNGKYVVQAGRRRLTAMRDYLNYTHLEQGKHFVVNNEVDDLVAQLEENLQRNDLLPIEAARLVKAIHERYTAIYGIAARGKGGGKGWTLEDTGNLLGKGKSFVSKMLKIVSNEDVVKDCPSVASALNIIDRERKKKILQTVQKVRASKLVLDTASFLQNYACEEANVFLSQLENASVDMILTDPPYGINYDEIREGDGKFEDSIELAKSTLKLCVPHFRRVIREGKYVVVWTSFELFPWLCDLMRSVGFFVPRYPLLWTRPASTSHSTEPNLRPGCTAECAVFAYSTPDARMSIPGRSNEFVCPPVPSSNKIHVAQKPDILLKEVIETFSVKGDLVLDVFAGSASTARACWLSGRSFIGCEKDETTYNNSITYTTDWIRKKEGVE